MTEKTSFVICKLEILFVHVICHHFHLIAYDVMVRLHVIFIS